MRPFRKMRPIGEWIWHQIPNQDRLCVEAKLFGEKHTIPLGQYDGHIEVISGGLRGRIQHRKDHWPQLAEDGLFIKLPESVVTTYKNKIRRRERPKITDIFEIPGLPEMAILEISKVDDLTWFMFEKKETIMRERDIPERNGKMDNEYIATLVAAQIAAGFGHTVKAEPFEESRSRGGNQFFSLPIEENFGIFSMVMKDAHVRIVFSKVESEEHGEHYDVRAALHYNHVSGGSNGSNIGTYWFTKTGELISFREG